MLNDTSADCHAMNDLPFVSAVNAGSLKLVAFYIKYCDIANSPRYPAAIKRAVDNDKTNMMHLLLKYALNE